MKLEIKKIALIIAAGTIAFSGAFGADQQTTSTNTKNDFEKVKVENNTRNYKVIVNVEGTSTTGAILPVLRTVEAGKTETMPVNEPNDYSSVADKKITFEVKREGETTMSGRSAIVTAEENEGKAEVKVTFTGKRELNPQSIEQKFQEAYRGRGPKVTAKVEGDTLIFTIGRPKSQNTEAKGQSAANGASNMAAGAY